MSRRKDIIDARVVIEDVMATLGRNLPNVGWGFEKREEFTRRYSWAIPNEEAISAIAELSPIIEIGAGTGYWAKLLRDAGALVDAFDLNPPDGSKTNQWHQRVTCHTTVLRGGPEVLAYTPARTLLLCWPPYGDPMAAECLSRWRGTLVYIGEGGGGCTGDDQFHEMLAPERSHRPSRAFRAVTKPQCPHTSSPLGE